MFLGLKVDCGLVNDQPWTKGKTLLVIAHLWGGCYFEAPDTKGHTDEIGKIRCAFCWLHTFLWDHSF